MGDQENINQDQMVSNDLDNNGGEDIDYKKQYEDISAQKEKIAKDFKEIQAQRDRLEAALLKQIDTVKSAPTVEQKTVPSVNKYDEAISQLRSKYNAGELDQADYVERIAELKAQKIGEEKIQEFTALQNKSRAIDSEQQTQAKYAALVSEKFPDAQDVNSPLYQEIVSLFKQYPEIYAGADKDNIKFFSLAQTAAANIRGSEAKNNDTRQRNTAARDAIYNTNTSGAYQPVQNSGERAFTQDQLEIMRRSGLSDKDIKRLEKQNQHFTTWNKNVSSWTPKDAMPDFHIDMHGKRG